MKTLLIPTLALALLAAGGATAHGQSLSRAKQQAHTASAGVQIKNENGKTVVMVDGNTVFTGATSGHATAKSAVLNGHKLIAVYDNGRVIWENVKGASQHIK